MEDEARLLSGQLEAVDVEIAEGEAAVASASDRMRHANAEFSSLMAAMSVAFREYDQAVRSDQIRPNQISCFCLGLDWRWVEGE